MARTEWSKGRVNYPKRIIIEPWDLDLWLADLERVTTMHEDIKAFVRFMFQADWYAANEWGKINNAWILMFMQDQDVNRRTIQRIRERLWKKGYLHQRPDLAHTLYRRNDRWRKEHGFDK
jgi:hypothetical protein